ncbi:MAG: FAD-dependent oxidoreductase [Rhodobacteraceae bacterium]|nr:FAD-dependent oxidoreductase [Paracoccaceae bacterium]
MQYVVIGNGIIAMSSAFRLLSKISANDTIILIGPNERVGSATLAAAAMLNSFAEIHSNSFKSDADIFHFELSHLATRLWPEFEKELIDAAGENLPGACAKCQIHSGGCFEKGTYILNNTVADELDDRNFAAIVQACEDFNEQYEFVEPQSIPNYAPSTDSRANKAILIHNEGWLNPRIVLEKLDAILSNHAQITVKDAKVTKLEQTDGKISSVLLDTNERIEGDVFLVANGAPSEELLSDSDLGLQIQPIFYGVGVSLEIKSPGFGLTKCIRTPNRGGACGVYTAPYFQGPQLANDHVLIGASNFLSPKPFYHGRVISIAHLLESATKEINANFADAQLVRVNVGWRPTSQDVYPLLGGTSIANLFVTTGTKRDGFHLAPVISQNIAALMCGEDVDPRLSIFNPEREPIRDIAREDAIEMGVESLISQHYQHGYRPSGIRMDRQYREYIRRDLEELHDSVGAVDWGIHPELINMYRRGFAK